MTYPGEAKIFINGGSGAVRLPAECRFHSPSITIRRGDEYNEQDPVFRLTAGRNDGEARGSGRHRGGGW